MSDDPYIVPKAALGKQEKKKKSKKTFKESINDWRMWVIGITFYAMIKEGLPYFGFSLSFLPSLW